MKRRILLVVVFVFGAAAVGLLLRPAEPVYRGHPVSYWIEPWQHHGTEPPESIAAAFAEMDERAVRWFIDQLDWRPSRLKASLNRLVASVISARFFNDAPDRREIAAMALGRLGPRAESAVPALEAVLQETAEPRARSAQAAALGALIRIRQEPLDSFLHKLRDPAARDWEMHAWAMWHLGTNAAPAVPYLVAALEAPAHDGILRTALSALAAIRSEPALTVPALARHVTHSNSSVRWTAIQGLKAFGREARAAWPALTNRLQDPESTVRWAATNALREIDADAARQIGLE